MRELSRRDLYLASLVLEGRTKDVLHEVWEVQKNGNAAGYQRVASTLDRLADLVLEMRGAVEGKVHVRKA